MKSLNSLHYLQLFFMAVPVCFAVAWRRKEPQATRDAVRAIRTLAKVHGVRYLTYERAVAGVASTRLREFLTVEAQVDLTSQNPGLHCVVAQLTAEVLLSLSSRAHLRLPILALHLSKFLYGSRFNQSLSGTTLTPYQILLGTLEEARDDPSELPDGGLSHELSVQFLLYDLEFHRREASGAFQAVTAAHARLLAAAAV